MNHFAVVVALLIVAVQPIRMSGQSVESLLLNGSLELNESSCVKAGVDSLQFVPNWGVIRSPDLVCVCDADVNGIWENAPRHPPSGFCYGIISVDKSIEPWWEYKEGIIGRFRSPLIENRHYCLEFLYSFSKGLAYITKSIDVRFIESTPVGNYTVFRDFVPALEDFQVNLEYDTTEWRKASFQYQALGGERSLVLGFLMDPNREIISLNSNGIEAVAILIDSIAVYDCTEGIEFELPNVFTPNGDGENEVYRSDQFNVERVEWVVLNRWGQVVHTGKAPVLEWDGRDVHSGEDLAEGVYFVRATAYGNDGSTRTEQQTVHLMR